jgi:hypothetical protein
MRRLVVALSLLLAVVAGGSAAAATPSFPLTHSADKRYLVDRDGVPFPILGRTAWFITSLRAVDWLAFLDDTAARGYTAIEFHVVNHDRRGNHPPFDGGGNPPFLKRLDGGRWNGSLSYSNIEREAPDFTTPNPAYWDGVDALLAFCQSNGMLAFMFPAYVGYPGTDQGWMAEITANGAARMKTYGAWLAARYRTQANIVWMLGGDNGTFGAAEAAAEAGLLAGLKSVAGQQSTMFSAEWSSDSIAAAHPAYGSAMTLDGAYSWRGDVNSWGRAAYAHEPKRPAFLLEEPYDQEGPDGNGVNPHATQPVRRFQWWGWLSTISGYIAGNGYVWPFTSNWRARLDTPGARDMARLNAFIRSIAWYRLVPSGLAGTRPIVTSGESAIDTGWFDSLTSWAVRTVTGRDPAVSAADYVAAAAAPDGSLMVAYLPPAHAGPITVDMTVMARPARARWLDPTTARLVAIGDGLANAGQRLFTPPGRNGAGAADWVLMLDAAAP